MKVAAVEADSRNGPMEYIEEPVLLTLLAPECRVITDARRDANPFFHMAEAVWMLGGGQGLEFVQYYNSGMARYSDDGATLHGAYGHRWRRHFYRDQIVDAITLLDDDPDTRRAYVAMFDAEVDHGDKLDIPCNVGLNFRVNSRGDLDMTVFNRSNDVIWGALGANVVHMTVLQELVAHALGRAVGRYRVSTACLHGYTSASQYGALRASPGLTECYTGGVQAYPLLKHSEHYWDMLKACEAAVAVPWQEQYGMNWLDRVWVPARDAWRARKEGGEYQHHIDKIAAPDWRMACDQWCQRRANDDN
jgi:hypothetical protein